MKTYDHIGEANDLHDAIEDLTETLYQQLTSPARSCIWYTRELMPLRMEEHIKTVAEIEEDWAAEIEEGLPIYSEDRTVDTAINRTVELIIKSIRG